MNNKYTGYAQDTADDLSYKLDSGQLEYEDLIEIMSSYFRSFSEGLDFFLTNYTDYDASIDNVDIKTSYIIQKCKASAFSLNPSVVKGWFSKEPRHNIDGRMKIFGLCFALDFDIETTKLFFQKVYLERCFDCHNMKEAILFYCMKNHLSYAHAIELISKIPNTKNLSADSKAPILYTQAIEDKISSITNEDSLLDYLEKNKYSFIKNKISAKEIYDDLLERLKASSEDINIFRQIKEQIISPKVSVDINYVTRQICKIKSPCFREYCEKAYKNNYYEIRRDFGSDNFVLAQILDTYDTTKALPNTSLPDTIAKNFAYRKILNDVRHMSDFVTYDMLRKQIILLYFYDYWIFIDEKPIPPNERFDSFVQLLDDILQSCGYEHLYYGNAYDWLFLLFSLTDNPIESLRLFYDSAIESDKA